MPDREFIHAAADVARALEFAMDAGLSIIHDSPQTDARPNILSRDQAAAARAGVFLLFREEWVMGPFGMIRIEEGHGVGKYVIQPRVNLAPITAYFQGEREDDGSPA